MEIDPAGISVNLTRSIKEPIQKTVELAGTGKKNYLLILPEFMGNFAPMSINNQCLNKLESGFDIRIPLSLNLDAQWFKSSIQGEWKLTGQEILKPQRLIDKLPFVPGLQQVIKLCEDAIRGNVDFEKFKSSLDRIDLDFAIRDKLIREMFSLSAIRPDNTPILPDIPRKNAVSGDSTLDNIISMVDDASQSKTEKPLSDAVNGLIEAAASDNTGYTVRKDKAKDCLEDIKALEHSLRSRFTEHPELKKIIDVILSLGKLIKKINSREKQMLHIIPGTLIDGDIYSFTKNTLLEGGSVEGICLYQTLHEESNVSSIDNLSSLAKALKSKLFLQLPGSGEPFTAILRELSAPEHILCFSGEAAVCWSGSGYTIRGWKPAALTWMEGIIINSKEGWAPQGGFFVLENQDVIMENSKPKTCRDTLSSERWAELRDLGINAVNGSPKKDVVMFLSPVALSQA